MIIHGIQNNKQLDTNTFEQLMKWLTPSEQDKIRRFRRWQDAQSSLLGKVMIRSIICDLLGMDNASITFLQNEFGKPYLKDGIGFNYNISHSGEWVLCAIDDRPIGIDIEHIKTAHMDIAERFFSTLEYENLKQEDRKHQQAYFYDLWTLKESYIKADGRGLSMPLDSFSCVKKDGRWYIEGESPYYLHQYTIDPDYKLSVCAMHDNFPATIKRLNVESLLVMREGLYR